MMRPWRDHEIARGCWVMKGSLDFLVLRSLLGLWLFDHHSVFDRDKQRGTMFPAGAEPISDEITFIDSYKLNRPNHELDSCAKNPGRFVFFHVARCDCRNHRLSI